MLYLEDYLELIEHLPQELRDRLTLIRENDLKVNNSSQQIDTKVKQFFAEAKNLSPEQKQCNYESILGDYEDSIKNAGEKLHLADQTSEIMVKLIQRLDGELEKFKLELEADHAGITEQLERRSLELDSGIHSDDAINGFPNSSPSSTRHSGNFKDRRRSEHNQRHHPYHRSHNGYHVRAKLSKDHHNHDGIRVTLQSKQTPRHNHQNYRMIDGRYHPSNSSRQNSTATSPTLFGSTPASKPSSIVNEYNALGGQVNGSGHYNTNLTSFGNQGFKTSYKNNNLSYGHHHSALSAALSSATSPTTVHGNKISQNGLGQQLDHLGYTNRNALAPMAPDQQAYRYNQQHVKMNGNSSPLCVSVTKSGRPSKRPKHHASHLYPDESPASISSDISVFENSESLSSADFLHEQSPAFSSTSPSFDYGRSHMNDQGGGAIGEYQLDQTKYCICRQVSYGGMVACDNEECEIQWFHFGCVGLTEEPPGKWYCPECLISIGSQHKKNQAQTQPQQKKRGRKEKSAYNLMNSSRESTHLKTQERIVSAE